MQGRCFSPRDPNCSKTQVGWRERERKRAASPLRFTAFSLEPRLRDARALATKPPPQASLPPAGAAPFKRVGVRLNTRSVGDQAGEMLRDRVWAYAQARASRRSRVHCARLQKARNPSARWVRDACDEACSRAETRERLREHACARTCCAHMRASSPSCVCL
eukprot:1114050-Pleurochrysis_carterae.AAC.1